MPFGETRIVMPAEFCTSDLKRASSLRATSKRRRSVRSRMENSTAASPDQVTGAPITSRSLHPETDFALTSMSVPISLRCTLANERSTSSRSSGCTRSRVEKPIESMRFLPNMRSAAWLPHCTRPALSSTSTTSGNSATSSAKPALEESRLFNVICWLPSSPRVAVIHLADLALFPSPQLSCRAAVNKTTSPDTRPNRAAESRHTSLRS